MDFDKLISPLGGDEFMTRYHAGDCFVIRGNESKFAGLISLSDIERRLNDGCNLDQPPQVIINGRRRALVSSKTAWAGTAVRKSEVRELLESGRSLMMTNLSQINPAISALLDGIEDALGADSMRADLHLYVSTRADGTAYNAHRDYPQHKFYLQVIGTTQWQIYHHSPDLPGHVRSIQSGEEDRQLEQAAGFELWTGDMLYMPPAVFHKVHNTRGPRMSLSIPVTPAGGPRMDRTHIPFERLFLGAGAPPR